jgi:hypothetical protein
MVYKGNTEYRKWQKYKNGTKKQRQKKINGEKYEGGKPL